MHPLKELTEIQEAVLTRFVSSDVIKPLQAQAISHPWTQNPGPIFILYNIIYDGDIIPLMW